MDNKAGEYAELFSPAREKGGNGDGFIRAILLEHLWAGLLNSWIVPERERIALAARGIRMEGLELRPIIPIMAKTTHLSRVETDIDSSRRDHLFFEELFRRHIIGSDECGCIMDRYEQRWAVIIYSEQLPLSAQELKSRLEAAMSEAAQYSWTLNFYIGDQVLPEELCAMWSRLGELSELDVGYKPGVRRISGARGREGSATIPDMAAWGQLLDRGDCRAVSEAVDEHLTRHAGDRDMDSAWLAAFRCEFSELIYHSFRVHGIPASQLGDDLTATGKYARAISGIRQLNGWAQAALEKIDEFLSTMRADTTVKRAQKYILQNLDQPLTRGEIAARVFVSEGYLGKLFRRELGVSLSEYVFSERMKLASSLLSQTEMTVTAVAMATGYDNFPYFSTQFKRYSGLSPVEFRRSAHSGAES